MALTGYKYYASCVHSLYTLRQMTRNYLLTHASDSRHHGKSNNTKYAKMSRVVVKVIKLKSLVVFNTQKHKLRGHEPQNQTADGEKLFQL